MSERLFDAYFEKSLTDKQRGELTERLASDEDARKQFAEFARERGIFIQAAGRLAAEREMGTVSKTAGRRSVRFVGPLALAASLALGVGLWWWMGRQQMTVADVREVHASVERRGPFGSKRRLQVGHRLLQGETLVTGRDGWVRLALSGGGWIALYDGTHATFRENGVTLKAGRVLCSVDGESRTAPFRVVTPSMNVQVFGTQFEVVESSSGARVEVLRGKVSVTRRSDGATVEVARNESVNLTQDGPLRAATGHAARRLDGYADGPVIWQEDFESGLGDEWESFEVTFDNGRRFRRALDARTAGASVKIVADPEGTRTNHALMLSAATLKAGSRMGVRCVFAGELDAYSVRLARKSASGDRWHWVRTDTVYQRSDGGLLKRCREVADAFGVSERLHSVKSRQPAEIELILSTGEQALFDHIEAIRLIPLKDE